jgi:tetratricopeptide (TPR) repeat protein
MILKSPWTGYGYGLFERNYNLAQARYFNSGMATEEEIERADHITIAYNELIESTVEGGVIGTTLFWGFIGLLIYKVLRQFRNIHNSTSSFIKSSEKGEAIRNQVSLNAPAFAGVIAFTLMSLVNFTVQAVPVMCVFIIFSSLISAQDITVFQDKALTDKNQFLKAKEQLLNVRHSNKYQNQIVALILFVSVFAIELPFIKTGFAQYHLGKSVKTISTGNPANIERTIETMKDLRPKLSSCEGYYRYTAYAFFKLHDLQSAIEYYSEASKLTSNPDLFLSRGICYEKIGQYSAAEADYLTASYIVPNRIIPKYRLMLLYLQRSNYKEASAMARQIVEIQPKVNNSQSEATKKAAKEVLRKLSSRNNQVYFNTMQ